MTTETSDHTYSSIEDTRELECKAAEYIVEADKSNTTTIANLALKAVGDINYLDGCVAKGRGKDIFPFQPARNVFEYIKELELKNDSQTTEIEFLQRRLDVSAAELDRFQERERTLPTIGDAEKMALIRFCQEVCAALGGDNSWSPRQVVEEVVRLRQLTPSAL